MSYMKTITVREASRHFSRHADLAIEGEEIRVLKDGKPYVRIVADTHEPKACPKINYAELARKTYGGRAFKVNLPIMVIKHRR